jgi:hypothetical protein
VVASRHFLARRHGIPERDHAQLRMPRIVPEDAERSRIKHEALPGDDLEAKPPCCQHAGKVPVGEQGDIAIKRPEAVDQPVSAR